MTIRLIIAIILCTLGLGIMCTVDHPYIAMAILAIGIAFYGWHLASLEATENRSYLRV